MKVQQYGINQTQQLQTIQLLPQQVGINYNRIRLRILGIQIIQRCHQQLGIK